MVLLHTLFNLILVVTHGTHFCYHVVLEAQLLSVEQNNLLDPVTMEIITWGALTEFLNQIRHFLV